MSVVEEEDRGDGERGRGEVEVFGGEDDDVECSRLVSPRG